MLDEEMKQVEAGNGAVLGPWTVEHGWPVTLEGRPRSSSKILERYLTRVACPSRSVDHTSRGREASEVPCHRRGDFYSERFLF